MSTVIDCQSVDLRTTIEVAPGLNSSLSTIEITSLVQTPASITSSINPASSIESLIEIPAPITSVIGGPGSQGLPGPPGPPGDGESAEIEPAFSYVGGLLTRIDYVSGNYKTFSYTAGLLTRIDYVRVGGPTVRKTLSYNPDGTLAAIDQEIV